MISLFWVQWLFSSKNKMNNLNHKTDHLWIYYYQFKRKVQEAFAPCTYFY